MPRSGPRPLTWLIVRPGILVRIERKIDALMAQIDEQAGNIRAELQQSRDDITGLKDAAATLIALVTALRANNGQITPEVQSLLDDVQSGLAATHTDTTDIEAQLRQAAAEPTPGGGAETPGEPGAGETPGEPTGEQPAA